MDSFSVVVKTQTGCLTNWPVSAFNFEADMVMDLIPPPEP